MTRRARWGAAQKNFFNQGSIKNNNKNIYLIQKKGGFWDFKKWIPASNDNTIVIGIDAAQYIKYNYGA